VAVGDVNGDGKPDLVVGNINDNTVSVLRNTTPPGAATVSFAAPQSFATGARPRAVAVGDVNGDGQPDIVVANFNDNTVSVLLNTPAPVRVLGNLATGTITENPGPPPTVQFGAASESVNETAGTFSIPVTLSAVSGVAVSVPFTLGGTAVAGIDYSGVTASPLMIAAGQTSARITGKLMDDGAPDAVKTLRLQLGAPTNAALGARTTNTLTIADSPPPPPPPPPPPQRPPPYVSVALTAFGEVLVLVDALGNLTQFDPMGAHFLGSGYRSASVAFGPFGEILVVVTQTGVLTQFDAFGVHTLGSGYRSASVAISSSAGEVLEVAYTNGVLIQYDPNGAHPLLGGVLCASAAFNITPRQGPATPVVPMPGAGPFFSGGEVIDVIFSNGLLVQFSPIGIQVLGKLF
jgi:hypothetical protein